MTAEAATATGRLPAAGGGFDVRVLLLLFVIALFSAGCDRVLSRTAGVAVIEPEALRERLAGDEPTVIIDTRDDESFAEAHIAGARRVLIGELDGYLTSRESPPPSNTVVMVCYRGNDSVEAAAIAASHGYRNAFNLIGGMELWQERSFPTETGAAEPLAPELGRPPVVRPSMFEQSVTVMSGCVFKPSYMILSLLIIIWAWRSRAADVKLMRNALVLFLGGESFCAFNFLFSEGASEGMEILHGAGMVGMFGLLPWGLFAFFDDRVIRLTNAEKRCAMQRLCGRCWKKDDVPCGIHQLFQFAAPVMAFLALMPLTAPILPINVILDIYGHQTAHPYTYTTCLFELRLYPLMGFALMVWTSIVLMGGKESLHKAQRPFFIAFGFVAFSLFRFFLLIAYGRQLWWMDWWEESTELIAICAVGLIFLIFRRQLKLPWFGEKKQKEATDTTE